jgi:hypothetical protein
VTRWTAVTDLFALPWALLALPLLPLLPRGRGRPWRMAALAALIVALAQPQRPAVEDRIAVLVDVSASVGDAARSRPRPSWPRLGDDASVYLFAGDATRVASLQAATPEALDVGRTDLGRALAVADRRRRRRVLLLSDGVDAAGGPRATGLVSDAPNVPPRPVPVDVVVVPRRRTRASRRCGRPSGSRRAPASRWSPSCTSIARRASRCVPTSTARRRSARARPGGRSPRAAVPGGGAHGRAPRATGAACCASAPRSPWTSSSRPRTTASDRHRRLGALAGAGDRRPRDGAPAAGAGLRRRGGRPER